MLSKENFKCKSSEMAINASKTVNSNINFNYYIGTKTTSKNTKTTSYNLVPTLDQNLNE